MYDGFYSFRNKADGIQHNIWGEKTPQIFEVFLVKVNTVKMKWWIAGFT